MKIILLIILLISAVITDTRMYKIKNYQLIIGTSLGLIINTYLYGLYGAYSSIIGLFIPIILLFILFALHMLGAGDIKLLGTIGAILGKEHILNITAYSFVIGAIISLIILVTSRTLLSRLQYFFNYIVKSIMLKKITPYYNAKENNYRHTIHFSYAIAIGTIIYLMQYLI